MLRNAMFDSFKEFKSKLPMDDDFIKSKLELKVIIESSNPNYQHFIGKPTNNFVNQTKVPDHIECNFDKELLNIIKELNGFRKLANEGISINSEKYDDLINVHQENFRIYRENIMLAVRDYNLILKSMDHGEKQLFKENLKQINQSLMRGVKTLSWGNKSLLDNFVKDV